MSSPEISIIVPCYNAASVLRRSVEALVDYLTGLGRTWELVIVDDGSTDATWEVLQELIRRFGESYVYPLHNDANRGKGCAVRNGMLAARGRYRIFIDVDLNYRPPEIGKILSHLEADADVAIASRVASGARVTMSPWHIQYIYTRHLMSRLLNKVFRNLFVRGILDSQAGLKGFTDAAAQAIFPLTTVDGFSFDIEVLYIAQHLRLTIEEVGIDFIYGREPSTVKFLKDGLGVVRDMIMTKVNEARGLYDTLAQSSSVPARQRLLVVTADDFGLSEWANRGIIRGVEAGAVSSVSVMAGPNLEPWPDAVGCDVGFGLHINLTEGRPVSGPNGLEPILTADGSFSGLATLSLQMLRGTVSIERLTQELMAQAEKVRRAGFVLDHIDGHEHIQHLPGVRQAVAEVARRLGIIWVRVAAERLGYEFRAWGCTAKKIVLMPFLVSARSFFHSCGLRLPDRFFGLALVRPRDFEAAMSAAVSESRGDVNEISLHLAEAGGEQTDRLGKWRCKTLESLLRCDLPAAVAGTKLELTNFGKIADRKQYTTVAGKEIK